MKTPFVFRSDAGYRERSSMDGGIASISERLLQFCAADSGLAEAVLGDLAEERALRAANDGARAASWWYAREALRSAPHLIASGVRRASWRDRARLTGYLASIALASIIVVTALFNGSGPPARLVANTSDVNGVIVNNTRPVQLAMRVLDAAGNALPDSGVRYRWSSGIPVPLSPNGVATCTQPGDATVHASLGPLITPLLIRCRPVHDVRGTRMMNLVIGGPATEVPFLAVDADDQPVTLLRGQITVQDTSVATVNVTAEGNLLRARAPGSTGLNVRIGNRAAYMSVHVYEPVRTPEGIRPGQHVAVSLHLAGGEMRRWRLAAAPEIYYIAMLPDGDERHTPRLAIVGASCSPALDDRSFFCLVRKDATVFGYHSRKGDQTVEASGTLAVWRQAKP